MRKVRCPSSSIIYHHHYHHHYVCPASQNPENLSTPRIFVIGYKLEHNSKEHFLNLRLKPLYDCPRASGWDYRIQEDKKFPWGHRTVWRFLNKSRSSSFLSKAALSKLLLQLHLAWGHQHSLFIALCASWFSQGWHYSNPHGLRSWNHI